MKNSLHRSLLLLPVLLTPGLCWATDVVKVEAGNFQMGCSQGDPDCGKDEGKQGGTAVFVKTFYIDKLEVSVADYNKCMKSGNCPAPADDHDRNQYCNQGAKDRNDHPINCVDWDQALAFCKWKKGRLPYEAEWEKAARAGSHSRFPWGQNVSCKNAILDDGVTTGSVKGEPDGCGEDRTWTRASRPANAYGLFDMHGNAGEWTANWYKDNAIEALYAKGDLKGPKSSKQRVVRGGSWDENKNNLRSSYRNVKPPVSGRAIYGSVGFRCAYDSAK
ncbi:MAG TPA: formylglycine-generating enzyme family protein [Gammaproteobacteria bacterium]|nr:formylglycine-generating enzyme family protein [Gammaproteobacteria bacterium]